MIRLVGCLLKTIRGRLYLIRAFVSAIGCTRIEVGEDCGCHLGFGPARKASTG